jgi:hypothetical protein
MNRRISRVAVVSAIVWGVSLACQVSRAAADTFNWDVQFAYRYDWPSGSGSIPPVDFSWTFEFDPVVDSTQLQDNQPGYLRTWTYFAATGISTGTTPFTADIWANEAPAGATFTHTTSANASQAYMTMPCAGGCGFRTFGLSETWVSDDLDADPNVTKTFTYYRHISLGTQNVTGFGEVAMFNATSILEFIAMAGAGYEFQVIESFQTRTQDLTTWETTMDGSWWNGTAKLAGHVPGSPGTPTPVPEPASIVLVATGLAAAVIRKRAGLC